MVWTQEIENRIGKEILFVEGLLPKIKQNSSRLFNHIRIFIYIFLRNIFL